MPRDRVERYSPPPKCRKVIHKGRKFQRACAPTATSVSAHRAQNETFDDTMARVNATIKAVLPNFEDNPGVVAAAGTISTISETATISALNC